MNFGITGKVAMVAAASRGIGLATAEALAREGAKVSICALDPARLQAAVMRLGPPHMGFRCDVSAMLFWMSW